MLICIQSQANAVKWTHAVRLIEWYDVLLLYRNGQRTPIKHNFYFKNMTIHIYCNSYWLTQCVCKRVSCVFVFCFQFCFISFLFLSIFAILNYFPLLWLAFQCRTWAETIACNICPISIQCNCCAINKERERGREKGFMRYLLYWLDSSIFHLSDLNLAFIWLWLTSQISHMLLFHFFFGISRKILLIDYVMNRYHRAHILRHNQWLHWLSCVVVLFFSFAAFFFSSS